MEATVAQTVHHCGRTSLSGLDCKNFSCRIVAHFIAPCAAREGGREGRISGRGNWGRGEEYSSAPQLLNPSAHSRGFLSNFCAVAHA